MVTGLPGTGGYRCKLCNGRPKRVRCLLCGAKRVIKPKKLEIEEDPLNRLKREAEEKWLEETAQQMSQYAMKTTGCVTLDERVKQYHRMQQ